MRRRALLRLAVGSLGALEARSSFAQGVATHATKPVPRRALSGRPFNARLVDVAREAGLREPVVYGPVETKTYIVETIGCGCAFFDYDNDGWMDVFILSGTRRDGDPPGATNRLYKNNRDGTFTDVTAQAGLTAQHTTMGPFGPRAYAFRATGARLLTAGEHNFAIGFRGLATDPARTSSS